MKTIIIYILLIGIPRSSFEAVLTYGEHQIFNSPESAAIYVYQNNLHQVRLLKLTADYKFENVPSGNLALVTSETKDFKVEEVSIPKVTIGD